MQQQRSRQSNVVAANHGPHKILLKTVDNNVLVLAVSMAQGVQPEYELCSAFGTGNSFRYLAAHEIAIDQRRHMYSLFHSLTGRDAVHSFDGKKTIWTILPEHC